MINYCKNSMTHENWSVLFFFQSKDPTQWNLDIIYAFLFEKRRGYGFHLVVSSFLSTLYFPILFLLFHHLLSKKYQYFSAHPILPKKPFSLEAVNLVTQLLVSSLSQSCGLPKPDPYLAIGHAFSLSIFRRFYSASSQSAPHSLLSQNILSLYLLFVAVRPLLEFLFFCLQITLRI